MGSETDAFSSQTIQDDEDFECFVEMIRPIFLRMRLTGMLKMNPYAKYMKETVTNIRKIPEAKISTLKSIISKHGGNFSFRYLSFISDNFFHILSIRIHFEHISQTHTQEDRSNHFSKALKILIILCLGWFRRKGHGFLNPWFSFFPCFLATKSLLS